MAEVSASDAVGAGLRLVGPALGQANIALGLLAAALVLTELAPGAQDNPLNMVLLFLIRLPFLVIAVSALLRLALGPAVAQNAGGGGPGGLQWHGLEGRVLSTQLLVTLASAAAAIGWMFVASLAAGVLMQAGAIPKIVPPAAMTEEAAAALVQGPAGPIMLAIFLPAVLIGVFVYLKLSLALAATTVEGEVKVFRTWAMTRGVLWPAFAVWLLGLAVQFAFFALGMTLAGVAKAVGASLEVMTLCAVAAAAAGAIIALPATIGGYAHIYLAVRRRGSTQVRDGAA